MGARGHWWVPVLLVIALAACRPGRLAEAAQHGADVWAATLSAGVIAAGGAIGILYTLALGLALVGLSLACTWRGIVQALWHRGPSR